MPPKRGDKRSEAVRRDVPSRREDRAPSSDVERTGRESREDRDNETDEMQTPARSSRNSDID